MEDKDQKRSHEKDEAWREALLYIAALLGYTFASYDELAQDKTAYEASLGALKQAPSLQKKALAGQKLSSSELNREMAKIAEQHSSYARVITVGDSKVCERCRRWQGKVISLDGKDPRYPSLEDYLSSDAVHKNCRCSLQAVKRAGNCLCKHPQAVYNFMPLPAKAARM